MKMGGLQITERKENTGVFETQPPIPQADGDDTMQKENVAPSNEEGKVQKPKGLEEQEKEGDSVFIQKRHYKKHTAQEFGDMVDTL